MAILNHTSTSVETEPQKPSERTAKPPLGAGSSSSLRWIKRDTLLLLVVLLVAGGLRILRLAEPNAVVFDETYYAKDACLYLGHTQQFCGLDQATEQSYVHPPLGKWLISLGISAFGYNSFGWRFSAALFGTALAGLIFLLARKLFRDRWTAAVAGLLSATDFLLVVQSRIAMLDIFLAFFVALGFFFLVLDRDRALSVRDHMGPPAPGTTGVEEDSARPETTGPREDSGARSQSAAAGEAAGPPPPARSEDWRAAVIRRKAEAEHMEITVPPTGQVESAATGAEDKIAAPSPPKSAAVKFGDGTEAPPGISLSSDPPPRGVAWRFAAGAGFGLALAVKWSALLALCAAAVCALFWSMDLLVAARKRRSAFYGPLRSASLGRELGINITAFFLIPALIYVGSYAAYFVDRQRQDCPFSVPSEKERLLDSGLLGQPQGKCIHGPGGTVLSFIDLQDRIFDYHSNLTAKHTYQSKAWTWPLLLRPVAYFYESGKGKATEVMALGNVVTWYGFLIALVWLVVRSLRAWRPERVVLVAWGAQYLPWLLVSRPLFLFYMTPAVPFMMIGLASALNGLRKRWAFGRKLAIFYLLVTAALLFMFYPVISAVPLPQEWWERLMWIPQFDCGGLACGWI